MSTIVEPSPNTHDVHADDDAHIPGAHQPASFYIRIALILAVLTALETSTYWIDFGSFAMPLLLILMGIKFVMVVSYFMHLKFDNPLFSFVFYSGLILAIGVYVGVLATFEFFIPSH
ncbi:MAG: cytochrome C oxidase subunit IV family protein [Ilumatobacteraceae bacterium]